MRDAKKGMPVSESMRRFLLGILLLSLQPGIAFSSLEVDSTGWIIKMSQEFFSSSVIQLRVLSVLFLSNRILENNIELYICS